MDGQPITNLFTRLFWWSARQRQGEILVGRRCGAPRRKLASGGLTPPLANFRRGTRKSICPLAISRPTARMLGLKVEKVSHVQQETWKSEAVRTQMAITKDRK